MSDKPKSTFAEARNVVITFGQYAKPGPKFRPITKRTLDALAEDDEGLLYLDWLRGSLHERCESWQLPIRDALDVFFEDKTIAKELQDVMEKRGRRRCAGDHAQRERQKEFGF